MYIYYSYKKHVLLIANCVSKDTQRVNMHAHAISDALAIVRNTTSVICIQ